MLQYVAESYCLAQTVFNIIRQCYIEYNGTFNGDFAFLSNRHDITVTCLF